MRNKTLYVIGIVINSVILLIVTLTARIIIEFIYQTHLDFRYNSYLNKIDMSNI